MGSIRRILDESSTTIRRTVVERWGCRLHSTIAVWLGALLGRFKLWVFVRRLLDLLVLPARDVDVLLPLVLVERYETIRRQLGEHGLHLGGRDVVSGEDFGLQGLGAGGMVPTVVAEVPQANEQEASDRRALHDLLAGPELGLDGADACHQTLSSARTRSAFSAMAMA
ncbi:hypothetical protein D9M68_765820 [compost metagenome]